MNIRGKKQLNYPRIFRIDYKYQGLIQQVRSHLHNNLVIIEGVPRDTKLLLEFMTNFGTPMRKINAVDTSIMSYIGDIRVRLDILDGERMPTQSFGKVDLHTARSYAKHRPRIFAMFKHDEGFSNAEGESLFLSWDDFIYNYKKSYGKQGIKDINVISNTNVRAILDSYSEYYTEDKIGYEPLIKKDAKGGYFVRYWVKMKKSIQEAYRENKFPIDILFVEVINRFDDAINHYHSIYKIPLRQGELVIMDNRKFAHGRLPFRGYKETKFGLVTSTRQIYNFHLE